MKIKVFDKFIFMQVLKATVVCLLLFVIVWVAPEILLRLVKQVLQHETTILGALNSLMWEMPKVLGKALPVGILLGAIFTFDKLSKDSELTILRGIGLSFWRIIAPVCIIGAFLSVMCYYITDKFIPISTFKLKENDGWNTTFVYIKKDAQKRPEQGVIVSNYTHFGIKDVTVVNFSIDHYDDAVTFDSILFAPYAIKKDTEWILPAAKRYKIDKGGIYEDVESVNNVTILEGDEARRAFDLMSYSTRRERSYTNAELGRYLKLLKEEDFSDEYRYTLNKYFQRFLHPIVCLLFAILGCLLGFSPPRSQRLVGFTVAIGFVFLYYITLPFFDLMAEKGVIPPFITASFPMIAFLISIFVIKKIKDL